ncbi:hypothetical protein ABIB51_002061 [Arthrobacter sp. UYCu712]
MHSYCTRCGHFHGRDGSWSKCIAVTRTEAGGAKRCACSGPNHTN